MAATSSSSWVCTECGKVCKSRGGLVKHSSIHKRHPRVGESRNGFHRIYHPTFTGMFVFESNPTASNASKGDHVLQMESFFQPEHHQAPRRRNLTTIGPPLHRVLGLSSRRYCTTPRHSQTASSINCSTSGVLRWSLTMTLHQSPTTMTFTRQSTPSNSVTSPGSHIPSGTMAFAQSMDPHPNG